MIIRRVKLRNIKSYYGEHTLDLQVANTGGQLHLIGAQNGSGKTTLFESVNACLFASQENPILKANDLSRGGDAQEMEVEIEFEHESQLHRLNRRWVRRPGHRETSANSVSLISSVENVAAGDRLADDGEITRFINDLIPRQISHFFLFDGEQIQEFTDEAADSVREALERLLGLHHYIQLLSDLQPIERDLKDERDSLDIGEDLNTKLRERDAAESELKDIDRNISRNEGAARRAKSDYDDLQRKVSDIDSVFDESYRARRRELEERRDNLNDDAGRKESELKSLISTELVVALFWPMIQDAYKEIVASPDYGKSQTSLEPEELVQFLWEQRSVITSALGEESPDTLQSILTPIAGVDTGQSLHYEGVETLARMVNDSSSLLWSTLASIDDINSELSQIVTDLNSLPSSDSITMDTRSLHQEMEEALTRKTRYENNLANLNSEKNRLAQELERLAAAISELSGKDSEFKRIESELILCRKVQRVLEHYIADYRATRVRELEDVFNRKFRELTNNPQVVSRVEIDRDSFDINVTLQSDANLAASEGSAGQKEVLAFALIASVVELSNKQLPIVIDTPLARLDDVHRNNILTKFFPEVGEQVIVLATDAEVGLDQRRRLEPYLASEHHLVRDAEGRTSIKGGYLVQ